MDKSEVIQALDETKRVLTEKGWTQGYYAVTADETHCEPEDVDAVAFCVMGAAAKACETLSVGMMPKVRDALLSALPPTSSPMDVFDYNDEPERTFDEVLALIDWAKELVVNGQV